MGPSTLVPAVEYDGMICAECGGAAVVVYAGWTGTCIVLYLYPIHCEPRSIRLTYTLMSAAR